MKKIKEIWTNNRVLLILATIVIACFIIIAIVGIKFFFKTNTSNYGDRLENIENIPVLEEDISLIKEKIKEQEVVTEVNIHQKGKIIYIRITFINVTLEKAKEIATASLETVKEEYKNNYDIHYTLVSEATENQTGFTLMGAKNISRQVIIWNNNTPIKEETEE